MQHKNFEKFIFHFAQLTGIKNERVDAGVRVLRDAHLSAMHNDKRYKEKEEEEELDELESSALLLFGCD